LADIHPTAIVDDSVELADDVYIGPGCVLRDTISIGSGTILHGNVYLQGPLTIGSNNVIYPFSCIGFAPQHAAVDAATRGAGTVIGDGNKIRESVTIHRAMNDQPTLVGDRNFLMGQCHIGHDAVVGNDCTLVQSSVLGGHVTFGDSSIIGGLAGMHQFCAVGRFAMISGGTGLTQDIPPFCTAYPNGVIGSLNLVGLRRAGFRKHIAALQKAFDIFFKGRQSNKSALDAIEETLGDDPFCMEFVEFVRASKRGIVSYKRDS
jgi:UDP-N-acetylglucosamine acyltransferase